MEESKAFGLYKRLREYVSLPEKSICVLHLAEPRTPCPQSKYFCGTVSKKPVLDFDSVKELFCHQEETDTLWPSVDAVLYKDELFLFVEIKGWRNFDTFQVRTEDSQEEVRIKAENQAFKFNLKQKVEKSMDICRSISGDELLFDSIPLIYVLITDIETILDPLVRFRAQLSVLSYKAVNIPIYTDVSLRELNQVGMTVRYLTCRKFDDFYDSL